MDRVLIMNKLMDYKNIRTQKDFAEYLGITPQLMNKWFVRNHYKAEILINKFPEVNPLYITAGEGEFLKPKASAPAPSLSAISAANTDSIIKMYETIIAQKDEQITLLAATVRERDQQINKLIDLLGKK